MKIVMCAITLGLTILSVTPANAADRTLWSTVGSSCILDTGSVSKAASFSSTGLVQFADTQTGTIHLTCPVQGGTFEPDEDPVSEMRITFYDTDETADGCWLKATLRGTSTGTSAFTPTPMATYDGSTDTTLNGGGAFVFHRNEEYSLLSTQPNFDLYYHWIDIELFRNTTDCNVSLVGARLIPNNPL